MHPNPTFRRQDLQTNLNFARKRGFGVLSVNGDAGPLLAHVPFLLNEGGDLAELHLLRSNPIARIGDCAAVIAISGPDGYVSPDWYGVVDQVPTWNYVAVHLRGRLRPMPDSALRDLLDRESALFEQHLAPKPPWTTEKMTPDVLDRMMRSIQPFSLNIEAVDGTWKLNQNKPDTVRHSAADHMSDGVGQELEALAALMRKG